MKLIWPVLVWLGLLVSASHAAAGDFATTGTIRATTIAPSGTGIVIDASKSSAVARITTVSSSLISASNISGTLIQAGQSTASCASAIVGSFRYQAVSNTIQVCTSAGWKSLVSTTAVGSWYALPDVPAQVQAVSNSGGLTVSSISTTSNQASFTTVYASGNVGVGTTSPNASIGVSGTVSASVFYADDAMDSSTSPSFSWFGDTNTGMLNSSADSICLTTNGTCRLLVNTSRFVSSVSMLIGGTATQASSTPSATLHVLGTISATGTIQAASSTSQACSSGIVGGLRYTNVSDSLQICTGSGWKSLVSATGGIGGLSLAGGVTLTNPVVSYTSISQISQTNVVTTTLGTIDENVVSATTGSSYTINTTSYTTARLTVTNNASVTFLNAPGANYARGLTVIAVQGGSGGYRLDWPASVKWSGGVSPTLSTGVGSVDIINFFTPDQGSNWYGFLSGSGMQ